MRRRAVRAIRLRGVRHNNLKNFDLDLPLGKLVVVTGLSGSGKSSLAFDTLFAEGQRRYIETFSPYARQFFDRMDKPQVDRIEGIPPAVAIEQRNAVKTTRSTVGTMTELCDYMKLLWPHLAQLYCRNCGAVVRKESPQWIWNVLKDDAAPEGEPADLLVLFTLPLSEKLSLKETLALVARQGYQRLFYEGEVLRLDEASERLGKGTPAITVVQDRVRLTTSNRARFVEACEQAYHFGKGRLTIHRLDDKQDRQFSRHYHCAPCDVDYREPTAALFSFNHPVGACPTCRGFGRVITIDYDRAIPDRSKTLGGGAIKPWQTGHGVESQRDMVRFCKHHKIPLDVPFEKLPRDTQEWVINGDPGYGEDEEHEWPRAWYGVKGYFRWLESKAYKMHVRVLLSRYRAYSTCPDCHGDRFQPEALGFKVDLPPGTTRIAANDADGGRQHQRLSLAQFYRLSIDDAVRFIETISAQRVIARSDPIAVVLDEVRSRLGYLVEVGLGYLTLDRPTRSLSGGETERVNLTACLGTRLVNTLFVLDEPSVGLHARDTARLVKVLEKLRDTGNTVVVVEHEAAVMRAADELIDLGPGQGEAGGEVVFQGSFSKLLKSKRSLTGHYLSGAKQIEPPQPRPVRELANLPRLIVKGARQHNLKDLTVEIPLGRFVCLTGVSGSGKTTLAREVLLPALEARLRPVEQEAAPEEGSSSPADAEEPAATEGVFAELHGAGHLGRVVLVDQTSLGKTPRSNPVVYIGAFDDIRGLFAQTPLAQQRGLTASAFSFNSAQGQCERCRGAGFEKIEMQFLSDVYIRCPDCQGRRYRAHILEVKLAASLSEETGAASPATARSEWSIADLLDATVDDAIRLLLSFYHLPQGRRALQSLQLLQEVGLGYLRLGQPINTLSGGESQRLKLVSHLAEFSRRSQGDARPTLFLFDEPTTGLHFDDVRVLLQVFQRLVNAGHSLLVIEHNLDVIRSADWVIDLGPEAGEQGGYVVAEGTPEMVAACRASHTGQALAGCVAERPSPQQAAVA